MSFSTFETLIQEAKLWRQTEQDFEVIYTDSSGAEVTRVLTRTELDVEDTKLTAALDTLLGLYGGLETAQYLRCVEAAQRLLPTQLFDENNPTGGRTWSKWTYFKTAPHSQKQEVTLMYEMHDGIITYPLTLPEPVWRLCYPGLMNRYDAAQAMGMSATATATFCTPQKNVGTSVTWPDNLNR